MKFLKFGLMFASAFLVACVLIFTFIQEPFKILVPAQILTYKTPAIPVYIYVAGAFGLGLLIGLWVAAYYYIIQKRQLIQKGKEMAVLEEELNQKRGELEKYQAELEHKDEAVEQWNQPENPGDQI